jgi:hypothetical protein
MVFQPAALIDNPGYRPPEVLGTLSPQGAPIDTAKWKFRKALPVAKPGAQQVELDQDVLAHSSENLADVRVVQADHQIPFILERPSITRTVPLSATRKIDPDHPSRTIWTLKLPQSGLPLKTLTCLSSSPLFERTVRLWEEVPDDRGDVDSQDLGRATWSRTPGDPQRALVLELDSVPQSAILFLETDNGDNAAIDLGPFEGAYPVTRAVFKAGGDSSQRQPQPFWLYYGNPRVGSPSYDLRLIADDLLRAERQPITAGPPEAAPGAGTAVSGALTGASRYIFWGALILVVVVLLTVTARLLPKENPAPPPPQ